MLIGFRKYKEEASSTHTINLHIAENTAYEGQNSNNPFIRQRTVMFRRK